jgi:hypothetical protein
VTVIGTVLVVGALLVVGNALVVGNVLVVDAVSVGERAAGERAMDGLHPCAQPPGPSKQTIANKSWIG